MAVLTSVDGKVYEIPDDKLSEFELSDELLAQIGAAPPDRDAAGPDVNPSCDEDDAGTPDAGDERLPDTGPEAPKAG